MGYRGAIFDGDATSDVQAANIAALGVAWLGHEELLRKAGAELIVTSLDNVSLDALAEGRLGPRSR